MYPHNLCIMVRDYDKGHFFDAGIKYLAAGILLFIWQEIDIYMDNIRDYLKDNILITDGAFGTYYAGLYDTRELPEKDNINYKDRITAIHSEYIELVPDF